MMNAQKKSARSWGAESADQRITAANDTRSTTTEAQRDRILAALRVGPKTSDELRRMGCYQAPARIHELRHRFGFDIHTELLPIVDAEGFYHARCARYTLQAGPEA